MVTKIKEIINYHLSTLFDWSILKKFELEFFKSKTFLFYFLLMFSMACCALFISYTWVVHLFINPWTFLISGPWMYWFVYMICDDVKRFLDRQLKFKKMMEGNKDGY
jgi:hypothetical protein